MEEQLKSMFLGVMPEEAVKYETPNAQEGNADDDETIFQKFDDRVHISGDTYVEPMDDNSEISTDMPFIDENETKDEHAANGSDDERPEKCVIL